MNQSFDHMVETLHHYKWGHLEFSVWKFSCFFLCACPTSDPIPRVQSEHSLSHYLHFVPPTRPLN